MFYRILRAGVPLSQRNLAVTQQNNGATFPLTLSYVYTATTSGSATYTAQIAAESVNTSVADFGDATFPRQFIIEDLGTA